MKGKKTHIAYIAAALTAGWAGLILFLSSQSGAETSQLSRSLSRGILSLFGEAAETSIVRLDAFLRRLAHVVLFFGFGGLITFWASCVKKLSIGLRAALVAGACVFAAFFDELHKRLIPGRHFSLTESLINLASAAAGSAAVLAVYFFIRKRRDKNARKHF